eukprot:NODE_540_length_6251_cov_1.082250.p8 type:complete len:121 gc:universal NODE_540_length_6251_cov_1.082250:2368-2006(-)
MATGVCTGCGFSIGCTGCGFSIGFSIGFSTGCGFCIGCTGSNGTFCDSPFILLNNSLVGSYTVDSFLFCIGGSDGCSFNNGSFCSCVSCNNASKSGSSSVNRCNKPYPTSAPKQPCPPHS